jgi:hypothetical protein
MTLEIFSNTNHRVSGNRPKEMRPTGIVFVPEILQLEKVIISSYS